MDPVIALPAGATDTLPLYAVHPAWLTPLLCLALSMAFIVYLLTRSRPKPKPTRAIPAARSASEPKPSRVDGWTRRLNDLESQFLEAEDYRSGLHALAALIRAHLTLSTGVDVESWTASRIRRQFGDNAVGEFAQDLRDLRFARDEPTKQHFRSTFRRAHRVFKPRRKYTVNGNP